VLVRGDERLVERDAVEDRALRKIGGDVAAQAAGDAQELVDPAAHRG
jgi:hypothetical protein